MSISAKKGTQEMKKAFTDRKRGHLRRRSISWFLDESPIFCWHPRFSALIITTPNSPLPKSADRDLVLERGETMESWRSVSGWIARLKAGDEQAVQPLWERYFHQLVQLARKRLQD